VSLDTPRVLLRPPSPADYEYLRMAEVLVLGPRWRHRGQTLSPEQFAREVWNGVLAQFLVTAKPDQDPVGWVQAFNADLANGHVEVALARLSPRPLSRAFVEGIVLFFSYLFDNWPLRKLYFHIAEFNLHHFENMIGRYLHLQGQLTEHLWAGGRTWDLFVFSLDRPTWADSALARRLAPIADGRADPIPATLPLR